MLIDKKSCSDAFCYIRSGFTCIWYIIAVIAYKIVNIFSIQTFFHIIRFLPLGHLSLRHFDPLDVLSVDVLSVDVLSPRISSTCTPGLMGQKSEMS